MSFKKKEYGMTCYFAVKNDGAQQFNKRAACSFLTKGTHFLPSQKKKKKLKLTVGINISARQQAIQQLKKSHLTNSWKESSSSKILLHKYSTLRSVKL